MVTDPSSAAHAVEVRQLGEYVLRAGFKDQGEALHGRARGLVRGETVIRVPIARDGDYGSRVLTVVQALADVLAG